ncbi:MAG: hypothetical protein CL470_05315 [Acidimicrobiaceae bacterium]|nr:hypothetical protein [Acidimicrobiaceae bacterium]|tara:strand:+ start:786 stop:1322 length:537 start_codon:yes stop_codon:yes gene_type:complete
MNLTKRGIEIIPRKKKNILKNENLFPKNHLFFHANSCCSERKESCLTNHLIHIGAGMYEENMKEKRKGKGSTSHQAELFIKSAIKNKTILYLFENGIGQKGKYTHYGIFNGKIESSDKDIYNNITIKQPGIWKEEFQYAFYVHKWIPLNRSQQLNVYNTINPKGKSRRKTIQKINNIN